MTVYTPKPEHIALPGFVYGGISEFEGVVMPNTFLSQKHNQSNKKEV